jgi:hypothetical protein
LGCLTSWEKIINSLLAKSPFVDFDVIKKKNKIGKLEPEKGKAPNTIERFSLVMVMYLNRVVQTTRGAKEGANIMFAPSILFY